MAENANPSPDADRDTGPEPDVHDTSSSGSSTSAAATGPTRNDTNGSDGLKKRSMRHPRSLKERIKHKGPPGGYDPTPLPDAPQGFTIKFTFRSAANLPPADLSTASSDPFLLATLKTNQPKRHKEDPHLTHRTRTLRMTTEPEWNDEWVVANIPKSGFTLKCKLYDEDSPDRNDRLGNVTIKVPFVYDAWEGIPPPGKEFAVKKRVMSRRAYFMKGVASLLSADLHMTPRLCISMEVLGPSEPPHSQVYTVAPATWVKHYSPMIGRLVGTKVDKDPNGEGSSNRNSIGGDNKSQKYDFQANELQLQGPVPWKLYHRYVEFKPIIGSMFSSKGLRGRILNKALHKQHSKIYNFDRTTEYGTCEPCSEAASLQFLRLAHFDEGGRLFTYVLTLDGLLRFAETGKEFGIDLLSKHTMHSDVETYVAFSGEFFIRRLQHPDASEDIDPNEQTHPKDSVPGGPPKKDPPLNPSYYQLIIDNDSGTYRPDKSLLPDLKSYVEKNFPGLGVVAMHWEDDELQKLKEAQLSAKKKEGRMINFVMNRSMSSISSAESQLDERDETWEQGHKSKREQAFDAIENPDMIKEAVENALPGKKTGESSGEAAANA